MREKETIKILRLAGATVRFHFGRTQNFGHTGNWDVSAVTTFWNMFKGASSFNQALGGWKVDNVQTMGYMFRSATSFNQDLSDWRLNSVTSMIHMFYHNSAFDQDLGWCVDDDVDLEEAFVDTKCESTSMDSSDPCSCYSLPTSLSMPGWWQNATRPPIPIRWFSCANKCRLDCEECGVGRSSACCGGRQIYEAQPLCAPTSCGVVQMDNCPTPAPLPAPSPAPTTLPTSTPTSMPTSTSMLTLTSTPSLRQRQC